jgi:hypothetical protein
MKLLQILRESRQTKGIGFVDQPYVQEVKNMYINPLTETAIVEGVSVSLETHHAPESKPIPFDSAEVRGWT